MTENLGRKLTLIVALAVAAIACLVVPQRPFRLGLDLQGGTRLEYKFDFEGAHRSGKISDGEFANKAQMLQDFCNIIRGRVDPQGVMELSIRPEGEDRIVIELPGAAELSTTKTIGKLALAITEVEKSLTLDAAEVETVKAFPLTNGVVTIGSERIAYEARAGAVLSGLRRGDSDTKPAGHAEGEPVELISSDDLQKRIENVGDLQFLVVAKPGMLTPLGTDQATERGKIDKWIAAHPNEHLDGFHRLEPAQGGPVKGVHWYPYQVPKGQLETPVKDRLEILVLPPEEWIFSGNDLDTVGYSNDEKGYPAVSFEMSREKRSAFSEFTKKHIGDRMAIVLNGEIVTAPNIKSQLPGGGIIEGGAAGFTSKEVKDLITVLRSGSLRIRPELLGKSRVGASLGENYVKTGLLSTLIALCLIVVFMLFFYHKLGVFSIIGLVLNLLFLAGGLAFMQATLTLPGVAGIILTLGMAVDGNILIYERLREEMARGLKLVQAAKAAFEHAAVTIIDSNLTTLIAGLVLQYAGTGPIRGFAVTLNIGILTTLFTVIVVTEVLVFLDIKRGATGFSMAPTFKRPSWRFMDAAKIFIPISVLVMVVGDGLFISLPDQQKLGMDFLGGFRLTVNTQEPHSVEDVAQLVHGIPGIIGESAQVREIRDFGSREKGYTQFLIQCKLSGEESSGQSTAEKTGEAQVRQVLAPILQKDPVQVGLEASGDAKVARGEVYFERTHSEADVSAAFAKAGLSEVQVHADPQRSSLLRFEGKVGADRDEKTVASQIRAQFEGVKDSTGLPFSLLSPVPESSVVGPQVGGELRDKAVIAVLLSLVGTILYLRVRFAEYSYGIAVVVSLLHDVLIVFGALAVATMTGAIQAEFDLAMVAAFLTVIGYSQNDTIVIFDRVRENRRHSKAPLRDILNDSINQTLARTILTTSTVVIVLVILFLFNWGSRNVLEAFSFAMLVGVISGAYSTVYVASPVLLWLEKRAAAKADREGGGSAATPSQAA